MEYKIYSGIDGDGSISLICFDGYIEVRVNQCGGEQAIINLASHNAKDVIKALEITLNELKNENKDG